MDSIEKNLLAEISDLHSVPEVHITSATMENWRQEIQLQILIS